MIEVVNKSHRFSFYNKVNNCILDPNSFAYQSSKRQGYAQRLYFEYCYTQKVNGTTYFYTLTYNDKHIPVYPFLSDKPTCFSYDDIRYVTNGVLSKTLERKYGSRLRYFCACETGEGKGTRGLGHNPHYHFIFFVQPIHKDGVPIYDNYKPITPQEFRSIIRKVWHGTDNFISYDLAEHGIAKEGDNCGLVRGVAPFKYVSKYVLKDNNELDLERRIFDSWCSYYKRLGITNEVIWYFYKFNSELQHEDLHYLFYYFQLDKYNKWRHFTSDPNKTYVHYCTRYGNLDAKVRCTELNEFFTTYFLHMLPKLRLREYINEYSGKVRCSKSLGEYGINYIKFKDTNPTFQFPDENGFDFQTITQYYYRKLYYDKYICDVTGNVLYRLNSLGIKLKLNSLEHKLQSIQTKVKEAIEIIHNSYLDSDTRNGFSEFRKSHVLKSIFLPDGFDYICKYSIYKTVYQYRHYNVYDLVALDPCYSPDYYKLDYTKFIENDSYFFDYDTGTLFQKLYNKRGYLSFDSHDCIKPYIPLFRAIDEMLESVSLFRSNSAKRKFAENKDRAKRINSHLNS